MKVADGREFKTEWKEGRKDEGRDETNEVEGRSDE